LLAALFILSLPKNIGYILSIPPHGGGHAGAEGGAGFDFVPVLLEPVDGVDQAFAGRWAAKGHSKFVPRKAHPKR